MGATAQAVALLLSQLTSRASLGQLVFTVATTNVLKFTDHPYVRRRPRGPAPWALISWNARYRSPSYTKPIINTVPGVGPQAVAQETYPGVEREFGLTLDPYRHTKVQDYRESVTVDQSDSLAAQWEMLLWVQACFDMHDQRMKQGARPPGLAP